MSTLNAFVHTLRYEAEGVISVELRPSAGEADFPAFAPGSHIDLHLPNGLVRSYSLSNDCREANRYVVGVLRDAKSRGGSRCVHEAPCVGMTLLISAPSNNFVLHEDAAHSVLVAGGIGITPLLCMARRLNALGRSFELLYFARSRTGAAFVPELQALGMPLHLHFDDEQGGPPDLHALLATRTPASTHFYACGPAVMLDAFEKHCATLGYGNAHIERFAAVEVAASSDARTTYTAELRKSGKTITVTAGKSLLQTMLDAGVKVNFSCSEGVCGTCETRVLAGEPDHRDAVLSAKERARNKAMMVCVSGCKSEMLVLDV
jgi:tetrachlorobenzoquinone reductase